MHLTQLQIEFKYKIMIGWSGIIKENQLYLGFFFPFPHSLFSFCPPFSLSMSLFQKGLNWLHPLCKKAEKWTL